MSALHGTLSDSRHVPSRGWQPHKESCVCGWAPRCGLADRVDNSWSQKSWKDRGAHKAVTVSVTQSCCWNTCAGRQTEVNLSSN